MSSTHVGGADVRIIVALEDEDRRELLTLARKVITTAVTSDDQPLPDLTDLPPRLREQGSCFVTLKRGEKSLGATGDVLAERPLGLDVAQNALIAAFDDPRIPPISEDDLDALTVEISILTPLVATGASNYDDLHRRIDGKHDGLVVGDGDKQVTFLPAVWQEVRDTEDFLALLWRKAGLTPGDWPESLATATYRTETISDRQPS